MGLFGIEFISYIGNTFFATSFVVFENGVIGYSRFLQIEKCLVPTTVLLTFLQPVHC